MAAAGAKLAGEDLFHLYALQAAAWQQAWADCAAGWELDRINHLCAFLAAVTVRGLALTGCGATPFIPLPHIPPLHVTMHIYSTVHILISQLHTHPPTHSLKIQAGTGTRF